MHRGNTARDLVVAVCLASALVALFLWWADSNAARARAWDASGQGGDAVRAHGAGVSTAWVTTTEPVSTVVNKKGTSWDIVQYGVVITFPENAVHADGGAVFTFTPKSGLSLAPPLSTSPYCFELFGVYQSTGGAVSLFRKIQIALQYDPDLIGAIQEGTLAAYHYSLVFGWSRQSGQVDPARNAITFETQRTGNFCVGGYATQVFLPLVLNPTEG